MVQKEYVVQAVAIVEDETKQTAIYNKILQELTDAKTNGTILSGRVTKNTREILEPPTSYQEEV